MDGILRFFRKLIPRRLFSALQPIYHYKMALIGALMYRFASKHIKVVAITGTKGKTTTAELVNAILEEAGLKTALSSTLRFKIGDKVERNLYKMTMPGRLFVQRFLRQAVNANCDWAILEMTSEAAKQSRHKFIDLNALIFLNIAPEHIESHGSFEKYLEAKLKLAHSLEASPKPQRTVVANVDDKHADKFLSVHVENKLPYSLSAAKPYELKKDGVTFTFKGTTIDMKRVGEFSISNALAAATFAAAEGISVDIIKRALEKVELIRGRVEFIEAGQKFKVVVDYAHTPDSLKALYGAFKQPALRLAKTLAQGEYADKSKLICVLGNTGGGRDTWKRPEMGKIADEYCDEIILTNEDPYDEDPRAILEEMRKGFSKHEPHIILDRRRAIATALAKASANTDDTIVLITGKGTDPYIMGPKGSKEEWDDAEVTREELEKIKS